MITAHHHDSITSPDANRFVADWVSHRIWGEVDQFERYATTSITQDGALIAGVVWHNYQPTAGVIELSMAATTPAWLTRSVARDVFAYPFDTLGCQMVVTRTAEDNLAALRVNAWCGFTFVTIPRLRGRHEAEVIGTLTDDAWRAHPVYKRGEKG